MENDSKYGFDRTECISATSIFTGINGRISNELSNKFMI